MVGETRSQEIQREVVSLREYMEELRRTDLDAIDRRFLDHEKAVSLALAAATSRAELMFKITTAVAAIVGIGGVIYGLVK